MSAADLIEATGTVVKQEANGRYVVQLDNGHVAKAYMAGKMRVPIVPADRVKVELSPYDVTLGRIVWRL